MEMAGAGRCVFGIAPNVLRLALRDAAAAALTPEFAGVLSCLRPIGPVMFGLFAPSPAHRADLYFGADFVRAEQPWSLVKADQALASLEKILEHRGSPSGLESVLHDVGGKPSRPDERDRFGM
jgi:hypothetical protein